MKIISNKYVEHTQIL